MTRRILISLSVIGAVAALAIGGTVAYFSDTEASVGNTFTAGSIDLKIDNTSYAIDFTIPGYINPTGALVGSPNNSWTIQDGDLGLNQLFFNFVDLKPGDIGEDTISVRVNHNDAWICTAITITEDSDVDYTEPELADDTTKDLENPLTTDGELAENLKFIWWPDDGDNVLEVDEAEIIPPTFRDAEGELVAVSIANLEEVGTLSDSQYNFFTGAYNEEGGVDPVAGDSGQYIGKAWCFGEMEINPLPKGIGSPIDRPGSITCNGANVNNASQSDRVMGNIEFYAVQARNNADFVCGSVAF